MEGKDQSQGEITHHGPRIDVAGVTGGTVTESRVAGINIESGCYIQNLQVGNAPLCKGLFAELRATFPPHTTLKSDVPQDMECSGRSCTYSSKTYFDTCPECHLRSVRCIGKAKQCGRLLYTDENCCPSCGREVPATCQWMKTDGTPCKTRLKDNAKFCHKCCKTVWIKGSDEHPKITNTGDDVQTSDGETEDAKDKSCRRIALDLPRKDELIENATTTKWKLDNISNTLEILKAVMEEKRPLTKLFMTCLEKFEAALATLSDGCLEFCFFHENTSAAQNMMDRREEVLEILQQFLLDLGTDITLQKSDVKVLLLPAIASTNVIRQGDARADKDEETTSDYPDVEELQHSVNVLEKATANTEKMILLLSSGDRKDKMIYLSWETDTLRLFDIYFEALLSAHHLPTDMALDVKPSSTDEHDRDRRLETEDYMRHVLYHLKRGIDGRRDLFPLLGDMMKQVKGILPYLQAKTDYLTELGGKPGATQSRADDISEVTYSEKTEKPKKKLETLKTAIKTVFTKPKSTLGNLQSEDKEKQTGVPVDEGFPSLDHKKHVKQTDKDETVSSKSPDPKSEEILKGLGGKPEVTQSRDEDMNEVTDSEKTEELKKKLETLKTEADRKQQELREVREGTESGVEWEHQMDCLSQNMAQLKIKDVITDVIGEDQLPVISDKQMKLNGCLDGGSSTRRREMRPCLIYHLRKLQFGTLRQKDLMDIVRDVITVDQERLTNLRTQIDRLERVYGSPVHIVGEVDTEHSGPVSCPPMTLNRERVSKYLTVSEDGLEMVNSDSGDHHDGQYENYYGTCSRLPIPLPLSPSTLTVPQYWETHSRVQVKKRRSWPFLEMGLCGEGEVDTKHWVYFQTRSSWSVIVEDCRKHDGYCTQVWENGRQVGGCLDTVSRTPGTHLIYKLGIALDMGRGRLAFLDVKRGRVLQRLGIYVDESLVPMFGVRPLSGDNNMRLVSGSQLPITDTHKHLIAKALYSP